MATNPNGEKPTAPHEAPAVLKDPIWIIRILFVLTLPLCGFWVGQADDKGNVFSLIALLLALFIMALEHASRVFSSKRVIVVTIGAFAGLVFSRLFRDIVPSTFAYKEAIDPLFTFFFMYFGIVMALRNADRVSLTRMRFLITSPREDSVLLDTSAIIDGRIRQLYAMGFLSKNPIVPNFVLDELQALSDSRDAAKRHNGRKGLENLQLMKEVVPFQLLDKDYPEAHGVDSKLILLAKDLGASIVTNDYNLGKVAEIHQLRALNVNTLSAALRPNLSVGDQLVIALSREGKEPHQGVGYLEDGTMVVVDEGKPLIHSTVPVTIVGMMQTNAGRLAFARLLDDQSQQPPTSPTPSPSTNGIQMVKGGTPPPAAPLPPSTPTPAPRGEQRSSG